MAEKLADGSDKGSIREYLSLHPRSPLAEKFRKNEMRFINDLRAMESWYRNGCVSVPGQSINESRD